MELRRARETRMLNFIIKHDSDILLAVCIVGVILAFI